MTFPSTSVRKSLPYRVWCAFLTILISVNLILPSGIAYAQLIPSPMMILPAPGTMVGTSATYAPLMLRGVTVNPENPLALDFIIDTGDTDLAGEDLKNEALKVIKYFFAALTVPQEDMWVNLSPYEADRIVPEVFGQTEMGRDMLAQDYLLKQLTASLMFPDEKVGEEFWQRVYTKAQQLYGRTDLPFNTFNKVWITPRAATVYENDRSALLADESLEILLEKDYLALRENLGDERFGMAGVAESQINETDALTAEMVREVLIPEIEKEVNQGRTFANLRQIYSAMVLAWWYKQALKESLLGQVYVDRNKIVGVDTEDPAEKEKIYNQYLDAFKQGVYNFIKEDKVPGTDQIIPRKYFSGGAQMGPEIARKTTRTPVTVLPGSAYLSPEKTLRVTTQGLEVQGDRKNVAKAAIRSAEEPSTASSPVEASPRVEEIRNELADWAGMTTEQQLRFVQELGTLRNSSDNLAVVDATLISIVRLSEANSDVRKAIEEIWGSSAPVSSSPINEVTDPLERNIVLMGGDNVTLKDLVSNVIDSERKIAIINELASMGNPRLNRALNYDELFDVVYVLERVARQGVGFDEAERALKAAAALAVDKLVGPEWFLPSDYSKYTRLVELGLVDDIIKLLAAGDEFHAAERIDYLVQFFTHYQNGNAAEVINYLESQKNAAANEVAGKIDEIIGRIKNSRSASSPISVDEAKNELRTLVRLFPAEFGFSTDEVWKISFEQVQTKMDVIRLIEKIILEAVSQFFKRPYSTELSDATFDTSAKLRALRQQLMTGEEATPSASSPVSEIEDKVSRLEGFLKNPAYQLDSSAGTLSLELINLKYQNLGDTTIVPTLFQFINRSTTDTSLQELQKSLINRIVALQAFATQTERDFVYKSVTEIATNGADYVRVTANSVRFSINNKPVVITSASSPISVEETKNRLRELINEFPAQLGLSADGSSWTSELNGLETPEAMIAFINRIRLAAFNQVTEENRVRLGERVFATSGDLRALRDGLAESSASASSAVAEGLVQEFSERSLIQYSNEQVWLIRDLISTKKSFPTDLMIVPALLTRVDIGSKVDLRLQEEIVKGLGELQAFADENEWGDVLDVFSALSSNTAIDPSLRAAATLAAKNLTGGNVAVASSPVEAEPEYRSYTGMSGADVDQRLKRIERSQFKTVDGELTAAVDLALSFLGTQNVGFVSPDEVSVIEVVDTNEITFGIYFSNGRLIFESAFLQEIARRGNPANMLVRTIVHTLTKYNERDKAKSEYMYIKLNFPDLLTNIFPVDGESVETVLQKIRGNIVDVADEGKIRATFNLVDEIRITRSSYATDQLLRELRRLAEESLYKMAINVVNGDVDLKNKRLRMSSADPEFTQTEAQKEVSATMFAYAGDPPTSAHYIVGMLKGAAEAKADIPAAILTKGDFRKRFLFTSQKDRLVFNSQFLLPVSGGVIRVPDYLEIDKALDQSNRGLNGEEKILPIVELNKDLGKLNILYAAGGDHYLSFAQDGSGNVSFKPISSANIEDFRYYLKMSRYQELLSKLMETMSNRVPSAHVEFIQQLIASEAPEDLLREGAMFPVLDTIGKLWLIQNELKDRGIMNSEVKMLLSTRGKDLEDQLRDSLGVPVVRNEGLAYDLYNPKEAVSSSRLREGLAKLVFDGVFDVNLMAAFPVSVLQNLLLPENRDYLYTLINEKDKGRVSGKSTEALLPRNLTSGRDEQKRQQMAFESKIKSVLGGNVAVEESSLRGAKTEIVVRLYGRDVVASFKYDVLNTIEGEGSRVNILEFTVSEDESFKSKENELLELFKNYALEFNNLKKIQTAASPITEQKEVLEQDPQETINWRQQVIALLGDLERILEPTQNMQDAVVNRLVGAFSGNQDGIVAMLNVLDNSATHKFVRPQIVRQVIAQALVRIPETAKIISGFSSNDAMVRWVSSQISLKDSKGSSSPINNEVNVLIEPLLKLESFRDSEQEQRLVNELVLLAGRNPDVISSLLQMLQNAPGSKAINQDAVRTVVAQALSRMPGIKDILGLDVVIELSNSNYTVVRWFADGILNAPSTLSVSSPVSEEELIQFLFNANNEVSISAMDYILENVRTGKIFSPTVVRVVGDLRNSNDLMLSAKAEGLYLVLTDSGSSVSSPISQDVLAAPKLLVLDTVDQGIIEGLKDNDVFEVTVLSYGDFIRTLEFSANNINGVVAPASVIENDKRWKVPADMAVVKVTPADTAESVVVSLEKAGVRGSSSPVEEIGEAAPSDKKGGIDFNPEFLNLIIKRDGNGVPLPVQMQPIPMIETQIQGIVPVIINIVPVTNLPLAMGFNDEPELLAVKEEEI